MTKKSVLVADDDTAIRIMVRSLLRREGFDVEEASSGNEAIARLSQRRYDAVVLDVMMGEGSGVDVLQALALQRPDEKCAVVISAASLAIIEKVPEANVEVKLRKPFDIHELLEGVRRCVSA